MTHDAVKTVKTSYSVFQLKEKPTKPTSGVNGKKENLASSLTSRNEKGAERFLPIQDHKQHMFSVVAFFLCFFFLLVSRRVKHNYSFFTTVFGFVKQR